ncbi:cytochrome c peroxidase [Massilia sp. W12]|uniref:cytochrome-c peroxidase n=1 Tax=Massilia sp. W12 TaxID=3126507 RepID=UPI0030D62E87
MKKKQFLSLLTVFSACFAASGPALAQSTEPIKPLPLEVKLDPKKVALGARLFAEKRFSKNNDVSCMSCHDFTKAGGADPRPRSLGAGGAVGPVNSPTVLNSDLNIAQLWSGASPSLEEQVGRVVKNPVVFNSSWGEVLGKLQQDEYYRSSFSSLYKEGMTERTVSDAIATFERSLITPSRFDRYLRGDNSAITADEKKGYEKFKTYGCVACHQGMGVGGNMFQQFGVLGNYFKDRGNVAKPDFGRFNVTSDPSDKHVFKVPSLRNVEYTAPYFHDGTAKTLQEAVDVMFKYQLGRTAPAEDKELIVKFLKTLSADPEQLKRIEAMARGGK